MARCSLFNPKHYSLLTCSELNSLILFERVTWDWVREVHRYSSNTKKGKNFVIFRNSKNKTFSRFRQLIIHLDQIGYEVSGLENKVFKSDKSPDIIANRVGANKLAKLEVWKWIKEVEEEKNTIKEENKSKTF